MPAPFHLLIRDAAPPLPAGSAWPAPPALPRLEALLKRLRITAAIECDEDSPDTPFERALTRAHGLSGAPGQVPWAAFETGTVGTPCAWLRPCHWQLGMDHVRLLHPGQLMLGEVESQALLATVQALLQDDGMALHYVRPDAWLARGEPLRGLTTWSMARAVQQPLTREVLSLATTPAHSARLRRLQNELQMLLYTHPVNDAREQAGQWPVNALWIEGAGVLDQPLEPAAGVQVESRLAQAMGEPAAWRSAWQAIDADSIAQLGPRLAAGAEVRLTLCGPLRALSLQPVGGLASRLSGLLRPQRWADLYPQL